MGKKSSGRMINRDISLSSRISQLSPEALALFCLLIPHFNAHGKLLANPHGIKGTVCPLVDWLTVERVEKCLKEISAKTNVKWWSDEKRLFYLHSLNWKDHQSLREDRLGPDDLPDYPGDDSRTNPGVIPEAPAKGKLREGKNKEKEKEKGKKKPSPDSLRLSGLLSELILANNPNNAQLKENERQQTIERWAGDIDKMLRLDKRPMKEADSIIRWCQQDQFWQTNILSGTKLRKQYDQLLMQMNRGQQGQQQGGQVIPMGRRVY